MIYYHRLEKGTYDNSIKLICLIFQAFFSCYYDCTLLDTNFINIITSFPKNHEKNNDNLTCPLNFHIRLQSLFKKLSFETFKEFKIQDIVVVYLLHKSTFSKHPLIELQLFNQVSLNSDQLSHAILKRTQFYFVCPVLNRVSNGADWLILTISSLNVNIDTNFKASHIHDSFINLPPMV